MYHNNVPHTAQELDFKVQDFQIGMGRWGDRDAKCTGLSRDAEVAERRSRATIST